jgi:outer membrane protein insertion porin family
VVLTTRLNPGTVFHVAGLTFAGTHLVTQESFAATAKLHSGDVASRAALLESLAPVDAAYRNKGYLDVVIKAAPTLDATASTVAYAITVEPGEQYHLKQVTPTGIEGAALGDFNRGFLPKPGDVYDPSYVAGFLKANTALRALVGYAAAYKAYADPNTHTVDLVISFYKMGH